MPTTLKPVDMVIIGGGWTGLTMAREVTTRTPLSVLVLERGAPRSAAEYAIGMDELDYAVRLRMMQNPADETITHRHSTRDLAQPVRQYGSFLPGSGLGGAGEHWAGLSWRFYPDMFVLRSHLTEKHGAKNLPADLAVQDWGITYADLEPRYWRAEQMLGVGGKAGNLEGKTVEGGNIYEGPRSHEYVLPPIKRSSLASMFGPAARELGYHPHPAPSALLSAPYTNPDGIARNPCQYCGLCARFGCMIGAKAQPTNTLLPVLQRRPGFELRTGAWVRRIAHKNGRVTAVHYTDAEGREFVQPASVVVLSTFTLNNVRLLHLSKIGTPYDPATRRGTLGKNLTHQVNEGTPIFFDRPLNTFMGSGSLQECIPDFESGRGLTPDDGILRLGYLCAESAGTRPIASFGAMPEGAVARSWGSAWKAAAIKWYDQSAALTLAGEHLSWRQNYLDLDPTYTDKFGDPLLRFTLDWTEHERKQREVAVRIMRRIATVMGAKLDATKPYAGRYDAVHYQTTHIQGGAVMGASPETSVVNRHLQHWDVPDLWVVGASAYPQNASHNPTLTALALTLWASDALIGSYLRAPGRVL